MNHRNNEKISLRLAKIMVIGVMQIALLTACNRITETVESSLPTQTTQEVAPAEVTEEVEQEPEEIILTQEEVYQLYAEQVKALEERYGEAVLMPYSYGAPGEQWYWVKGLSYLRLMDFDGDGTEELIACYWDEADESPMINIYSIDHGECREVFSEQIGGEGSPAIFEAVFSEYEEKPCFVQVGAASSCKVFVYQDGEMVCVDEEKNIEDYQKIGIYSDSYWNQYYYSNHSERIWVGFNADNSWQAIYQAEYIRQYSNEARMALSLEQRDIFSFDNPDAEDYYVSVSDIEKGAEISERLMDYYRTELLPNRSRISEYTYFRQYAISDYTYEYNGETYESQVIAPGSYQGQTGDIVTVFRDLDMDGMSELIIISIEHGDEDTVRIVTEVFCDSGNEILSSGKVVLGEPALGGSEDTYEIFFVETAKGVCICYGDYLSYNGVFGVKFNALRYSAGALTKVISESFTGQYDADYAAALSEAVEREAFPDELVDRYKDLSTGTYAHLYCDNENGTEKVLFIKSTDEFPGGFLGGPLEMYLIYADEEGRQALIEKNGEMLLEHVQRFENGEFGVSGFFDIVIARKK